MHIEIFSAWGSAAAKVILHSPLEDGESVGDEGDDGRDARRVDAVPARVADELHDAEEDDDASDPEQPDRVLRLQTVVHGIPEVCGVRHREHTQQHGADRRLVAFVPPPDGVLDLQDGGNEFGRVRINVVRNFRVRVHVIVHLNLGGQGSGGAVVAIVLQERLVGVGRWRRHFVDDVVINVGAVAAALIFLRSPHRLHVQEENQSEMIVMLPHRRIQGEGRIFLCTGFFWADARVVCSV